MGSGRERDRAQDAVSRAQGTHVGTAICQSLEPLQQEEGAGWGHYMGSSPPTESLRGKPGPRSNSLALNLPSQEREKQIAYDITYIWDLKHSTSERTYETETDSTAVENRLVVAKGEEWIGSLGLADVKHYVQKE